MSYHRSPDLTDGQVRLQNALLAADAYPDDPRVLPALEQARQRYAELLDSARTDDDDLTFPEV